MFTGLVEELGTLESIKKGAKGAAVRIKAKKVLEGVKLGDSIAVDGVCLTVTDFSDSYFEADIMLATLDQTRIREVDRGGQVHLERALRVGDRLGGHFVSGHVDGQSKVISVNQEGDSLRLRIERSKSFWSHVVNKGSIAINGVSLTIDGLSDTWLEVSLVLHTQGQTGLVNLKPGNTVNIETDMLLKFVHQLMQQGAAPNENNQSTISMDQLRNAGFL